MQNYFRPTAFYFGECKHNSHTTIGLPITVFICLEDMLRANNVFTLRRQKNDVTSTDMSEWYTSRTTV